MDFRILGPLEVHGDDGPIDVRGRKPRAVLAVLLLHPNQPVSAERLAVALWGHDAPAGAVRTVHVNVSRLRKALRKGDILTTTPAGYRLRVLPGELDAERFEDLVEDGRRAMAAGQPEAAGRLLREALALWRGPPLGDLAFEPFAQTEITRLEEQHEAAIAARVDADLAAGRHEELVGELRRLVAEHPTHEPFVGQLMLALYRSGRQTDALDAYREARRRLVEEFGVEPGDELRALQNAILQQDPSRLVQGEPGPGVQLGRLPRRLQQAMRALFVGRDVEMNALADAWADVKVEGPGLVLVEGTAGIGKTRLAAQFADRASREGAAVLYGRCDEDLGAPYQPWIDILDQYREVAPPALIERHNEAFGPVLARLVPELGRGGAAEAPRTNDPEAERYLLFGAVAHLLAEASADRPLVVVVDDLHWADKPSLLLLRHLFRSGKPMRILVVGVGWGGSDDPSDALRDLMRESEATRLELQGLTVDDVLELFEAATQRPPSASERSFADDLTVETNGNPFFLVQILRHLMESGVIATGPDGWRLTGPVSSIELPEMVQHVIARRTRRLGVPAAELLQVAAVIGREFDADVLAKVAGQEEPSVLDALADAVAARLVVEQGGLRFTFSHALLNRALAAELLAARRARLHLAIADAVEALRGDANAGEIAHHRLAAGMEPDRAIEAAVRAGAWALARLAPDEAIRWFEAARKALLATRPDDQAGLCEMLIGLGEAQRQAGDGTYRATLLEAATLARRTGDADQLARAVLANSRGFESASGNVDADRVTNLEAAIALLGERDDRQRARLLAQLQLEQTFVADLAERRGLSDEAKALAERSGDGTTLAHVLWARHAVLWTPDLLAEHRANAAELQSVAAGLNDLVARFWAACDIVLTSVWSAAAIDEIDEALSTMEQLADRVGQPILRWVRLWYGSWRAHLAGDLALSERLAIAAGHEGTKSQQPDAEAFQMNQLMVVAWDRGQLGHAVPALEQLAAVHTGLPVFRAWLALAYCERNEPEQARLVFEPDAAKNFRHLPWDIVWLTTVCLYAEVATRLRVTGAAGCIASLIAPYTDQVVFNAISVHGSVGHYAGMLAAVMGSMPA
ncbi:MAG TPA: BTAD domain-containing putative transcriptional regulator, partial [Solirubrobacteraceae bacterium]|nr:BTAD domain-containing putative transcriptional regulator [Solirubrobacteraceae bacterium]